MKNFNLKKFISKLALAFFMASILLTGCSLLPADDEEQGIVLTPDNTKVEYTLASVQRGDVSLTHKLYCTYQEENGEELSFGEEDRRVAAVLVRKGDEVKAGDLLARLECDDLEQEKLTIEYILRKNRQLKANALELYDFDVNELKKGLEKHEYGQDTYDDKLSKLTKSVNEQIEDYDDAISVASIRLADINEKIAGCHIYAGMDGTVSYVNSSLVVGYTGLSAGRAMVRVIDMSHCVFVMSMEDARDYLEYLVPGENVTLRNSASSTYDTVVQPYDESSENIYLELAVIDEKLTIGTRLFVNIEMERAENVLTLPNAAVHKSGDKYFVYVADGGGLKSMQYIVPGLIGDQAIEIKEGLKEGDIVIKK